MASRPIPQRLRQHHAIEHATISVLSRRAPGVQVVARSDTEGFTVFGQVETPTLTAAAEEALRRLQEAFVARTWYKYLIPAAEALGDWPAVELDADQVELIRHGHRVPAEPGSPEWARGISEQGDLVALLTLDPVANEWQPKKVFFQS